MKYYMFGVMNILRSRGLVRYILRLYNIVYFLSIRGSISFIRWGRLRRINMMRSLGVLISLLGRERKR
jgi:hypothetical protein